MTTPDLEQSAAEAILDRYCANPIEVMKGGHRYYVRCGSRLKDRCPSCSKIVVGDWSAILRSGVFEAGPGFRWYLLTLTAPSFGAVHRVPREGGQPAKCKCGDTHTAGDGHLRGLPVDSGTYDYDAAVRWNRDSSKLWDNTRNTLRRLMPTMTFAVVREWQARGALHYHAMLRVPAAEQIPPELIRAEVSTVWTSGADGELVGWGQQIDCRSVQADESMARVIWYVSKAIGYLTKSVADGGAKSVQSVEHADRLHQAAQSISFRCVQCKGKPGIAAARCKAPGHRRWGASSAVVSVSAPTKDRRGWSLTGLTRTRQRQERTEWASKQTETARQAAEASKRRMEAAMWARSRTSIITPILQQAKASHHASATDPPF